MKCFVSVFGREGPRLLVNGVIRSREVPLHTVGYEAAEVTAHNAVPGRTLPLIELWETR
jgi:hypothetical protein